jgi:hypothetical protein
VLAKRVPVTSPPPTFLAIFPETVVRVGLQIIPEKPIGVAGGIEVFATWMVALPDFVKRVNEIQFPHRVVSYPTSQPDAIAKQSVNPLPREGKPGCPDPSR